MGTTSAMRMFECRGGHLDGLHVAENEVRDGTFSRGVRGRLGSLSDFNFLFWEPCDPKGLPDLRVHYKREGKRLMFVKR